MQFWVLAVAPTASLVARAVIVVYYTLVAGRALSLDELDRAGARGLILPLAGFSFSALLALAVLQATPVPAPLIADSANLEPSLTLLLLSFTAFYASLSLQAYKNTLWQDQLGTALREAGSGWLLFSVVAAVAAAGHHGAFAIFVFALLFIVWLADVCIRIAIDRSIISKWEKYYDPTRERATTPKP